MEKFNSEVVRVIHEPGNATRYEAIGVKLPFPGEDGQWLVSFPQFGTAYFFRAGAYVAYGYLKEKMGKNRLGSDIPEVDLHEMCKVVARIVGGTHNAATDATGRIPALRIAR